MKMDIRVLCQPSVTSLVGAIVVQDHVQLVIGRRFSDDGVHEAEKVLAALGRRDLRGDLARRHPQGSKEVERAMTLIVALETAHDLAIVCLDVSGRSLERLNTGLLITTDH